MSEPDPSTWPEWAPPLAVAERTVGFVCRYYKLDSNDAAEVAQDFYLTVLSAKTPARLPVESDQIAWTWTTTSHLVFKFFRERSGLTLSMSEDVAGVLLKDDEDGDSADVSEYLELLGNQREREAVRLRFVEELGFEAIAKKLDIGLGTAHKLVQSGLTKLRLRLDRD